MPETNRQIKADFTKEQAADRLLKWYNYRRKATIGGI